MLLFDSDPRSLMAAIGVSFSIFSTRDFSAVWSPSTAFLLSLKKREENSLLFCSLLRG